MTATNQDCTCEATCCCPKAPAGPVANPEELERAVERLVDLAVTLTEDGALTDDEVCPFTAEWSREIAADLRLILLANREMREAASLVLETNDRIVDAMLAAKDERTAASISLKGSDEFTATLAVLRSALTTQRGDGE